MIWLSRPFGRRAAKTPRKVPKEIAISSDEMTSRRVGARFSKITMVTG